MLANKRKITIAVSSVVLSMSATVNAQLLIHTDQNVDSLNHYGLAGGEGIGAHLTNLGVRGYIDKSVVGIGDDLPIELAMSSILPSGWSAYYTDDFGAKTVSWNKSGNWDKVLEDIAKGNNLVITIDWAKKRVNVGDMSPTTIQKTDFGSKVIPDAKSEPVSLQGGTSKKTKSSSLTTEEEIVVTSKKQASRHDQPTHIDGSDDGIPALSEIGKSIALVDGLVYCQENGDKVRVDSDLSDNGKQLSHDVRLTRIGKCENQKVDIEKMIMDTNWLSSPSDSDSQLEPSDKKTNSAEENKSLADIEQANEESEEKILAANEAKQRALRNDYEKSYILPKSGSFEDFVNGGGKITHVSPSDKYVYVYKRGSLFDTINNWAELNGFVVKNDVFDKEHIDYPNIADVKLEGTFKDVTTTVLNKYRTAQTPLMHVYLESGGSHVLHIFDSKYQSVYLK